jgi:hypothetical protein
LFGAERFEEVVSETSAGRNTLYPRQEVVRQFFRWASLVLSGQQAQTGARDLHRAYLALKGRRLRWSFAGTRRRLRLSPYPADAVETVLGVLALLEGEDDSYWSQAEKMTSLKLSQILGLPPPREKGPVVLGGSSLEQPIEVCGIKESYEYLALEPLCSDGSNPFVGRPEEAMMARHGSTISKHTGNPVDIYSVVCPEGRRQVYVDTYSSCPE